MIDESKSLNKDGEREPRYILGLSIVAVLYVMAIIIILATGSTAYEATI